MAKAQVFEFAGKWWVAMDGKKSCSFPNDWAARQHALYVDRNPHVMEDAPVDPRVEIVDQSIRDYQGKIQWRPSDNWIGIGETPRGKWEAAKVLSGFLEDNRRVFALLQDGQITVSKAIESLVILRAGNVPELPEDVPKSDGKP
jgi:hypothetical protein